MALSINTNLYALNAQRNLRRSESPLATAMQRLSSSLRINSAKDDAAGLAIATRMTRQINGLTVAMRNANNGVSFSQTAEGAMDEMINALQRIYELAGQSASYNTSLDRGSMNEEVRALVSELNRIVDQTRYGGEKFLNQAFSASFQVGVEVNEIISLSTARVSPDSFGVQSTRADFTDTSTNRAAIASAVAGMTLRATGGLSVSATLAGVDLGAAISYSGTANNSLAIINRVNEYTSSHNVTAFSFGNSYIATSALIATGAAVNAGYLTINGVSIGSTETAVGSGTVISLASALAAAINDKSTSTGVYAVVLGTADTGTSGAAGIALVNTTGAAISVSVATANAGTASGQAAFFGTSGGSVSAGKNGQVTFSTPLGITSRITDSAATTLALGFGAAGTTISIPNSQSANDVTVTTSGNANLAILSVKQSLETINTEKAKLGATLNRLESTLRNLDNVRENITAARSRIMDADFAMETANMTKALIMQQAGISILAQANTLPQNVLALLGGR
jgi:flagellin